MSETSDALLDRLLVKTSRTFALSIPRLPQPTRREVTVAYLLFRIADTLEDATRWPAGRQIDELERFAALLREPDAAAARSLADGWTADPPLDHDGYVELLARTPAVLEAFLALGDDARPLVADHTLRTIEMMAGYVRRGEAGALQLDSVDELRRYCYAVAGIVGEMLTELFVLNRATLAEAAGYLRERAARFGEALQLVNILKDADDDRREGRRYLPGGVDRAEVFSLARGDLVEAGCYVRRLQADAAPRGIVAFCALPVLLADATLERVERRGAGAKLTRPEVARIVARLEVALTTGRAAVPEPASA